MPTLNLGRVKAPPFVPRGSWDSGTAYVINDLVVGTSGDSFAAVADSTGEDPEFALGSWVFFAAAGADGTPGSDATVNATNVASVITGATEKTTPVDADQLAITDSAASNVLKYLTFSNLWTWITGKADPIYFRKSLVRKSSSTSRTSTTTFADDPDLIVPLVGGVRYRIEIFLNWYCAAAGVGFKSQGAYTGTIGNSPIQISRGSTNTAWNTLTYPSDLRPTGAPISFVGNTSDTAVAGGGRYFAILEPSTSGNFSIQWAQNTSSASAATVALGSYILIEILP